MKSKAIPDTTTTNGAQHAMANSKQATATKVIDAWSQADIAFDLVTRLPMNDARWEGAINHWRRTVREARTIEYAWYERKANRRTSALAARAI